MEEDIARKLMLQCLAGIILNIELHRNGYINKLLTDMTEEDYREYLKFLQTQINSIID